MIIIIIIIMRVMKKIITITITITITRTITIIIILAGYNVLSFPPLHTLLVLVIPGSGRNVNVPVASSLACIYVDFKRGYSLKSLIVKKMR